jgi:hypothetical protein
MTSSAILQTLHRQLTGQVIGPDDAAYDECRQVQNAMHDRRPAVIARCANTADVVAAVNVARDHGLVIAVRCGGHSVAGLSVCEGGVLIDLAGLKTIDVDPERRIARTGGGVLWGEFDKATQAHALHTPGGRVTTTGVGGFTTGGGYGWTSSKYGLTCDNLIAAEVVLANGEVVTASEREHADLFWGIRGGGGNFGIVTRFDFQLHPLGPIVLAGLLLFPVERTSEIGRAWRDYVDHAPDELSTGFALITAPPEPFVPPALRGQVVCGLVAMYVGDPEAGAPVVKPLRDLGPAVDLIQPMPYTGFQSMLDATSPKGARSYWRGDAVDAGRGLPHRPGRHGDARGRNRVLAPRCQLHVPSDRDLAGRRRRCADDGRQSDVLRRDAAVRHWRGQLELHRRRSRSRCVRRGQVRASGRAEGSLRSPESVPLEPEHRAERDSTRRLTDSPERRGASSHPSGARAAGMPG